MGDVSRTCFAGGGGHQLGVGSADRDQLADTEIGDLATDLLMHPRGGLPKFAHLAKNRDRRAVIGGDGRQRTQGRRHTFGASVESVVDNRHAVGTFGDLHSTAGQQFGVVEDVDDHGERHLRAQRQRGGGQRVGQVMFSDHTQPYRRAVSVVAQREVGSSLSVLHDVFSAYIGVGAGAEPDDLGNSVVSHGSYQRIIGVENGLPGGVECLDEFAFRPCDGLFGAELAEVCRAHAKHRADRGPGDLCEVADVPLTSGPHLQDQELGVRLNTQYGGRKPQLVVE